MLAAGRGGLCPILTPVMQRTGLSAWMTLP